MKPAVLAVIPARGGSKGLPGKNTRPFLGLPLIEHSIRFAALCPEVDRCIVSTDSAEIAAAARASGGDAPFLRPAALATDDSPLFPVLRHALLAVEAESPTRYAFVVLLDPTSPARDPADVANALKRLESAPAADGIVSVSKPDFNPVFNCVVEREGWMEDLIPESSRLERRQDAPVVYRVNGALYIWRAAFVRDHEGAWRRGSRHLLYEIPELRAMSIDTLAEFTHAEILVRSGLIAFPWLDKK